MTITINLVQNETEQILYAEKGALLSDVLSIGGVHIDQPCGGKGTCKRCGVLVNSESRLACRTKVESDMRVELGASNNFSRILAGTAGEFVSENPLYTRFGMSVDIGTTTICASLFSHDGGSASVTRKNPQTASGADVISRIEKAVGGYSVELAKSVRNAISEMSSELASKKGIAPNEIDAAVITGNTAMLYLLAEHSPEPLSHAPFEADRLFGEFVDSDIFAHEISQNAKVYLPRCISAFVGGDITTAILASGMCESGETSLLVDIGTNGELALWHSGKLACCSTAAGPAFEGAGISQGTYGINGAIDRVWIDGGKVCCSTIGGSPAVGICGSGIVDAVSVMLKLGVIDETGAFDDGDRFELQNGIGVTAQDIRKIQLAKGSVRAGLETLLEISDVSKDKVKKLYIAGGFGNYVNLENAAAIGLIPPELVGSAVAVGNAAHTGASMLLQDKSLISKSERLASLANTIALDANPVFTENYMTYMMFE